MTNTSKKYIIGITIPLILFAIISYLSITSASYLANISTNLALKQVLFYILGATVILILYKYKNNFIINNIFWFYIIGNLLLLGLLFFGTLINNARCWYTIKGFGTFQPSEFMKIILIILIAKEIDKYNKKYKYPTLKNEFFFLLKIILIVGIPSLLTFLEPDTGVVLIYLIITITMLFIGGIRFRWFIILFVIFLLAITSILIIYFYYKETFLSIFGTSFFLRIDRLLDWSNKDGYQLLNGLAAIGSAGLIGKGINSIPIYFPEPQTDFIFASYASCFGFIGSFILLFLLTYFDLQLIKIANNSNVKINKYIISGILGMLIYQQIQNIGMTIGLLPITGITLPFISYGGSSLLSYFIILGIIYNIIANKKDNKIIFLHKNYYN